MCYGVFILDKSSVFTWDIPAAVDFDILVLRAKVEYDVAKEQFKFWLNANLFSLQKAVNSGCRIQM
jgi:hypothetical protein